MKILSFMTAAIILLALFCTVPVAAQWQVYQQDLQFKATQINSDYTDSLTGQKGIFLSFNYEYKSAKNKLLASQVRLKMAKKGQVVYADSSQIWLLNPKNNRDLSIFIPFSKIKLDAAAHNQIELEIDASALAKFTTTLDFIQTARYKADILIEMGEIKRQLREYDPKESPKNWPPDPYIGVFYQGASQPIYKTRVFENSFTVENQQISFYIQPNANIELRVYDEDGEEDLLLATTPLPACVGDAVFNYSAQMFGDCKGFFYQVNYQQLVVQPINLSAQLYDYQSVKGVLLTAKYDLARTYTEKKSKLNFNFYDKNGQRLPTNEIIPLSNSPRLDSFIIPKTRGEWQYFVPFYAWRNNSHKITIELSPEVGEAINSTPCVLPQPIVFDNPVRMAQLSVQENITFQQVKGIFINIKYSLNSDLQTYEQLKVSFGSQNPNLQIYKIEGEKYQNVAQDFLQKIPANQANLQFFIPYAGMRKEERLGLNCQTKSANSPRYIDIIADTLLNIRAQTTKDVVLVVKKVDDYVVNGDYGKQFFISSKVPFFLQNKLRLKINGYKNGEKFTEYRPFKLLSNGFLQNTEDAALLFPYRFWQGKDSLSFEMWAEDEQGNEMSEKLTYQYRLPEIINTVQMRVEISRIKINPKKIPKDSSQTVLGTLQFWVGGDNPHQADLPALLNIPSANLKKQQFVFWAHREDKLSHKFYYNNDTSNLWTADWGKIKQGQYIQILRKKSVITQARIWILPEQVAKSPFKKFFFKSYHSTLKVFSKKKPKNKKR